MAVAAAAGTRINSHLITRTRPTRRDWGSSHFAAPVTGSRDDLRRTSTTPDSMCKTERCHRGGVLLQVTQAYPSPPSKASPRLPGGRPISLDQDTSPLPIVNAHIYDPDSSVTQEVQLISPQAGKIQWIIGLFYFHDVAVLTSILAARRRSVHLDRNRCATAAAILRSVSDDFRWHRNAFHCWDSLHR